LHIFDSLERDINKR